jgi:hypothetical protein
MPGTHKLLQQLIRLTKPAGDACLENIGHEKALDWSALKEASVRC